MCTEAAGQIGKSRPDGSRSEDVFDTFAERYDDALNRGLAVSGESKEYFAENRVRWLDRRLARVGFEVARPTILDFGCGTGTSAGYLHEVLTPSRVVGVDVSQGSLDVAGRENPGHEFHTPAGWDASPSCEPFDLAFCNGVFHHIPPAQRHEAVRWVFDRLRPGGLFAFWENHPWNPGTRMVMRRCEFDRDAVPLSPPSARRLLRQAGFGTLETTHLFIFPRVLGLFRPIERFVSRLPLGAQYLVLARRPVGP